MPPGGVLDDARIRLEAEKYAREFYPADWEQHVEAYTDLFDIETNK